MVRHDLEFARMKVTGTTPSGPATGRQAARSAGGFAVPQGGGSAPAAAATAVGGLAGVAGMSALMALQGVEDAVERRRRAVRRGSGLLDRLDELKLALLSDQDGEGALSGLRRTLAESRPEDDHAPLNALLDQIDLRAAVELAKAEVRRSAA
jgi:hypothetical protein